MKTTFLMTVLALSAVPAFAATKATYSCTGVDSSVGDVTLTIGNAHFVKVDDSVASLDDTYEPRDNQGYSRFEYEQSDEGTSEVLVQERLLKGSKYGFIKIQNRGEGFSTDKFACTLQSQ